MNIMDFIQGQQDCADGKPPKPDMSADYIRGYGSEYARQQNQAELSRRKHELKWA